MTAPMISGSIANMKSIHKNVLFLSGAFTASVLVATPCAATEPQPFKPSSIPMNADDFKIVDTGAAAKTPRLRFSYREKEGADFLSDRQRDYHEKLEYDRFSKSSSGISGKLSGARITLTIPLGAPPSSPRN